MKILLLYLKTGGGHLAPAKSVASSLSAQFGPAAEPVLVDGFEKTNSFVKYVIEEGYRKLQANAKWYYELLYAINKIPVFAHINNFIVTISVSEYLKEVFAKEKPDKIVIFHFFLIKPVYDTLKKLNMEIPVFTVVTDPFTAHPIWFLRKRQNFILFSERLKEHAVNKRGINPSDIKIFPFILNDKFTAPVPLHLLPELKREYGYPEDKKVILIMGGGDGIRRGKEILRNLIETIPEAAIAVVCGKNKSFYKDAEELKRQYNAQNVFIYGYIDFVYELLNISDVVITKCGASTFMEILLSRKIPVVNDYIWEQEKGNMEFLRDNNLGIYEKNIDKLPAVIRRLLNDEAYYNSIRQNIIDMHLTSGTSAIAEYIYKNNK